MDKTIHVIYGSSQMFIFPVGISAASIAHGLDKDYEVVFHILDMGIEEDGWRSFEGMIHKVRPAATCTRHSLSASMFDGLEEYHGSKAPYLRMFAADILPDVSWALYVDGDTLCIGDVSKVWQYRDESKLIVGSIDPPAPASVERREDKWAEAHGIAFDRNEYFCTGLFLMNLAKMREMDVPKRCRAFLNEHGTPALIDQSTLNYVCHGYISHLPPQWGVFSLCHADVDLSQDAIIHYVHDLPWSRTKINNLLSDIVMVWYEFSQKVLGLNLLPKYVSGVGRVWRRAAYVALTACPWIVNLHPYLRDHLRDTKRLTMQEWTAIRGRWA